VNFSLGVALLLMAFSVTLHQRAAAWLSRALFLNITGVIVHFAHIMAWMLFGLFCLAESIPRRFREGGGLSARGNLDHPRLPAADGSDDLHRCVA
jgi:hypothetical protein